MSNDEFDTKEYFRKALAEDAKEKVDKKIEDYINFKEKSDITTEDIHTILSDKVPVTMSIIPNHEGNIVTRNGRIYNAKELAKQMKEFVTRKPEELESLYKEMKLYEPPKFTTLVKIPTIDSKFEFAPICTIDTGKEADKTEVTIVSLDVVKSRPKKE